MDIKGKVVVISGGASGLGEATARHFLSIGVRGVVALDRDAARGAAIAEELGEGYLAVECDVADADAVQASIDAGIERFGRIDVAVAAAAIGGPAKLISRKGPIPMDRFDQVVKVNLYGTVHLSRSAALAMTRNEPNADGERGVIINLASGAAYEGQVGQVAYSASKAAIVGMTLPLMRELAEHGIRVVTVAPGAFDTPMYEQAPPEVKEGIVSASLFPKRMGKASEFALFAEEIVRNAMHNGRSYRFDAGLMLPVS
ncbi:SDR family NAD(P)-dependent oxidoreductase [Paraburkholderia elongata]|uniref:SDR family NAD(P)-dependent oxidoreductase n=1 Tax=Paraburkholderia elongata TaxID=2675747 RepID=A0A972NXF7_9BURK|nr:SDR family NAD(P)-dependent oxidoreductase [Paraburkholderia elongata]NPT61536.1 SDR family NAD(P)-dependent oxidoreductase [Paraburkholderia elongata]